MGKVSFIATVYNEKEHIDAFLDSLLAQSSLPDEVVIVDAGSSDGTWEALRQARNRFDDAHIPYEVIQEPGNRSHGRNFAIKKAHHTLIAVSDAGCFLDPKWLQRLVEASSKTHADVIPGFYYGWKQGDSLFQKALAAYTSTMPDKLDPATFLPSSRSVMFTRKAWEAAGGYPENLDTCEDLMFARSLRTSGKSFSMAQDALVYWPQKETLWQAALQFYSYAFGDGQAGYVRRTIPFLYGRYVVGGLVLMFLPELLYGLIPLYLLWAISKNYRYVRDWRAFLILPALQLVADVSVMVGMLHGYVSRHSNSKANI